MSFVRNSMIHDDAVTASKIKADSVTTAKIKDSAITGAKLQAIAEVRPGPGMDITFAIPNTAGNYDFTAEFAFEVVDATVQKRGNNGGAGDTITIQKSASAITNAMSINVSDQALVRASAINDTNATFAVGDVLRVAAAKVTDCQALVIVKLLKR